MFNTLISTEDLLQHHNDNEWRIFDCRFSLADSEKGRRDYQENHIPGAIYVHLNEDLSGEIIPGETGRHPLPDVEVIAERFSNWGIDETVQVVAYDDMGGMVAARLWWMLRWLGHPMAAVLDGGWKAWQKEDRPIATDVPQTASRKFIADPHPQHMVDAELISINLDNPEIRLIDSRSADRYRGENETIDPVAGHIPGAISLPFAGNLDENGNFLPPEALADRFRQFFEGGVEQSIFYCGSGVSACHNLLAMAHGGLEGALLYPGSWSDWITDKQRPVE